MFTNPDGQGTTSTFSSTTNRSDITNRPGGASGGKKTSINKTTQIM